MQAKQMSQGGLLKEKMQEQVLVVPRAAIEMFIPSKGICQVAENELKALVESNARFMPRELAEYDLNFKQIIPYLVFAYQEQLFLMQRSEKPSEARLASKFSLGVGGHLRAKDLASGSLFDWAKREFLEEVEFAGTVKPELVGFVNDESSQVGQVHTGVLWLVRASSPVIAVKEELKSGELVSLAHCQKNYALLESWSQMVVDHFSALGF
jgi:predicted NUDIX family phosphoesterase